MIRRSRFLTLLARAPDAAAAHAFVERIRGEYPDATHHCWAFVAGPPGSTQTVGMSDDGEPHGTAGRPMLQVLQHSGVGEIVAVCVRWYGGVKLGTGGLGRAYSGGVSGALEGLRTVERVDLIRLRVEVDYATADLLRRTLDEVEAHLEKEEYGAEVRWRVALPRENRERFRRLVAELSSGEGRIED